LITTLKQKGVWATLDVLARLPDYPANKVPDLPPWNWKANQQSKAAVAA
jgi:transposase